jgi:N-acetylmuramic acid 6-phosphate (MurNAc-6-P) etherase
MAEYIEDECLEEIEGFKKVLDGFPADGRDIYMGTPTVGGLGIIEAE